MLHVFNALQAKQSGMVRGVRITVHNQDIVIRRSAYLILQRPRGTERLLRRPTV